MYICFECFQSIESIKLLINHLKLSHFLTSTSKVICKQNNCNQIFSYFKAFTSHLKTVHAKDIHFNSTEKQYDSVVVHSQVSTDSQTAVNTESSSAFLDHSTMLNSLKEKAFKFSLNLVSSNYLPRSEAFHIQSDLTNIFFDLSKCLENISFKNKDSSNLDDLIEFCKSPFKNTRSEYVFIEMLKKYNLYEEPKCFTIKNLISERSNLGNPTLGLSSVNVYMSSLHFKFKAFFELPNILQITLENTTQYLNSTTICNYASTDAFRLKKQNLNHEYVIPFFLYFDDHEINNPLGSHHSSVCACYFSFPTIPQFLLSKLDFIFDCAFFLSKDLKEHGYTAMLSPLISEIKMLEEGIDICSEKDTFKVKFVLAHILGDNLELNSILGYVRSFNSNKFCRICTKTKEETKYSIKENEGFLRNKQNYEEDVKLGNFKQTGIKENCAFNVLPNFHVTDNLVLDMMHDVFEGIANYEVCQILQSLIDDGFISIIALNSRLRLFPYGETEIKNRPPVLTLQRIKTRNLKMSAREVWNFLHFLPLTIGDLIPRTYKPWRLLCKLIQIVDYLLKPSYTWDELSHLSDLIKTHHFLYIAIYGKTLKPKHHFLTHYATSIKNCGPIKYTWSMRFEARHRISKLYCNNTTSRKNISLTLCKKSNIRFGQFLLNNKDGIDLNFESKNFKKVDLTKQNYFSKINLVEGLNYKSINLSNEFHYKGHTYKIGRYLTISSHVVELYKIESIIIEKEMKFILCHEICLKKFDDHFQSFEVGEQKNVMLIKNIELFTSSPLHVYPCNNGKMYIRNKFL